MRAFAQAFLRLQEALERLALVIAGLVLLTMGGIMTGSILGRNCSCVRSPMTC